MKISKASHLVSWISFLMVTVASHAVGDEPDLYFVSYERAGIKSHRFETGLWHWDAQRNEFGRLLNEVDDHFVAYSKSSLALSPKGRWLAVSGLVQTPWDYSEAAQVLPEKNRRPQEELPLNTHRDHYAIYLIDLAKSKEDDIVATKVFDSFELRERTSLPVDQQLYPWRDLVLKEYGVAMKRIQGDGDNPESVIIADPVEVSFNWGEEVKIELAFSDDEKRLYFRAVNYRKEPTTDYDYNSELADYQGSRRSFVVDLTDLRFFDLSLSIMPNVTYLSEQTLRQTAEGTRSFTFDPARAYLVETRFIPKERATFWQKMLDLKAGDRYVHEITVRSPMGCADSVCSDVNSPPPLIVNGAATDALFVPRVVWNGDQLTVRHGLNDALLFSWAKIKGAAKINWRNTGPLPVAPEFSTTDANKISFHGLPMAEMQEHARNRGRLNQISANSRYLLLSNRIALAHGMSYYVDGSPTFYVDQPYLYDWHTGEARYLVYPFLQSEIRDRANATDPADSKSLWDYVKNHNRQNPFKTRGSLLTVPQPLTLAEQWPLPFNYLEPVNVGRNYEASPQDLSFDSSGRFAYFREARPLDEGDVVETQRDYVARSLGRLTPLPRAEFDFTSLSSPNLARIDLSHGDERRIQRLGYDSSGEPGWFNGLPVEGYQPRIYTSYQCELAPTISAYVIDQR